MRAILLEAAVEETLTEFISSGRKSISQLSLGFGRSQLAEALVQVYWNVRGQGLKLEDLNQRTLVSHATPEAYERALTDLDKVMSEFISFGRLTPAAEAKRNHARSQWPVLKELIAGNKPSLADYCSAIENFRSAARPSKTPPSEVSLKNWTCNSGARKGLARSGAANLFRLAGERLRTRSD